MKIYLENKKEKFNGDHCYEADDHLFEVDKTDIYDIHYFDNYYYVVNCKNMKHNYAVVKPLVEFNFDGEEKEYVNNITCPYCNYENNDSWDCSDNEDEYDCGRCGSTMKYERIVTVEYSSEPVKCNKVIKAAMTK